MSTGNIYTAMLAVYNEVGYVQKTGQAPQYKFASEADFIAALRPAMIKESIICTPVDITNITPTQGTSDKGKAIYHVTAKYTYRLTHAPSGTFIDVCSLGEGIDIAGDKSAYKTATGAQKYALRQAFMIETGTDPDDSVEEKQQAKAQEDEQQRYFIRIPVTADGNGTDWEGYAKTLTNRIATAPNYDEYAKVFHFNKNGFISAVEALKEAKKDDLIEALKAAQTKAKAMKAAA